MSNFKFLEKINKDLYEIGCTAEKLFRDEYFDQCIIQTRKMAESMTKSVLGSKTQCDDTFDDMIYKLKTISQNTLKEQEFISDMYFLKKHGNAVVHCTKSENNEKTALECLEHAFEASVNYASSRTKDETVNLLLFDEQLLMLGEKNNNLQNKYKDKLKYEKEKNNQNKNKAKDKMFLIKKNKHYNEVQKKNNSNLLFNKIFKISVVISLLTVILMLTVLSSIKNPNKERVPKISKITDNVLKNGESCSREYSISEIFKLK